MIIWFLIQSLMVMTHGHDDDDDDEGLFARF